MTTEERLSRLEEKVNAIADRMGIDRFYDGADKAGIQKVEEIHGVGISENDTAVCDVADLSDVNSQAIDDLAEMVDELSNKISEMEA